MSILLLMSTCYLEYLKHFFEYKHATEYEQAMLMQ